MKLTLHLLVLVALFLGLFGPSGNQPAVAQTSFDCTSVTEIPQLECEALIALYNSTNGAGWTDNTNWLVTNTPSNWYGVTVENEHVTKLTQYNNNLAGSISTELSNLLYLEKLYLNNNHLTGNIPPELGNLTSSL